MSSSGDIVRPMFSLDQSRKVYKRRSASDRDEKQQGVKKVKLEDGEDVKIKSEDDSDVKVKDEYGADRKVKKEDELTAYDSIGMRSASVDARVKNEEEPDFARRVKQEADNKDKKNALVAIRPELEQSETVMWNRSAISRESVVFAKLLEQYNGEPLLIRSIRRTEAEAVRLWLSKDLESIWSVNRPTMTWPTAFCRLYAFALSFDIQALLDDLHGALLGRFLLDDTTHLWHDESASSTEEGLTTDASNLLQALLSSRIPVSCFFGQLITYHLAYHLANDTAASKKMTRTQQWRRMYNEHHVLHKSIMDQLYNPPDSPMLSVSRKYSHHRDCSNGQDDEADDHAMYFVSADSTVINGLQLKLMRAALGAHAEANLHVTKVKK